MDLRSVAPVLLILIALLFIFISQFDSVDQLRFSPTLKASISSYFNLTLPKDNPKILSWTNYFSASLVDRTRPKNCLYQCEYYGKKDLSPTKADAIVFHFRDLYKGTSIPQSRRPDQIYVSFLKEAPAHVGEAVDIRKFSENFFNATVDYRFNNFTYLDSPFLKRAETEEEKRNLKPLTDKAFDDLYRTKTNGVLAVISNCHAESGRMEYIRELSKHINVTGMGKCFGSWASKEDVERAISSHKFVIAFENIQCESYATEKFWRIMKDIVPIVLQQRLLTGIAPFSSFLAADQFESPKDLAEQLEKAMNDKEEYRKYFAWRSTHYRVTVDGFCNLCRDLHFKNVSAVSNLNMKEYYSEKRECEYGTAGKLLLPH